MKPFRAYQNSAGNDCFQRLPKSEQERIHTLRKGFDVSLSYGAGHNWDSYETSHAGTLLLSYLQVLSEPIMPNKVRSTSLPKPSILDCYYSMLLSLLVCNRDLLLYLSAFFLGYLHGPDYKSRRSQLSKQFGHVIWEYSTIPF